MNLGKLFVFIILLGLFSGFHFFALAQTDPDFLGIEDFTVQKIADIITGFACWLIGIVLAIMVIALIIAGIRFFKATSFVTDGGKTTEINDAKKNLQWVLIGILVILSTNVIIATVANALGGSYSFLPLNCGPFPVTSGRLIACRDETTCKQIGSEWICAKEAGQAKGVCIKP